MTSVVLVIDDAPAVGANVNNTELCSMRLVCLAFYDTALTDSQWAQIMKHARIAYGVL